MWLSARQDTRAWTAPTLDRRQKHDVKTADQLLSYIGIPLEVAWVLYVLGRGSDAGLPVLLLLVLMWGGIGLGSLWAARVVIHLIGTKAAPETRRLRRLCAELTVLLLCFGAVWTGVAFRARFFASTSSRWSR